MCRPRSLDWEVVKDVFFHLVDSIANAQARSPRGSRRAAKVRTSDSEATTGIVAIPDDAAAKVMPPRETSTRNPHEEVVSSGSMMMASPVVKPAVSSNAKVRSVGIVGVRSRVASGSRAPVLPPTTVGRRRCGFSLDSGPERRACCHVIFTKPLEHSTAQAIGRAHQSVRPEGKRGWQPMNPRQRLRQVRQSPRPATCLKHYRWCHKSSPS